LNKICRIKTSSASFQMCLAEDISTAIWAFDFGCILPYFAVYFCKCRLILGLAVILMMYAVAICVRWSVSHVDDGDGDGQCAFLLGRERSWWSRHYCPPGSRRRCYGYDSVVAGCWWPGWGRGSLRLSSSTFSDSSGHRWTVFGQDTATVAHVERGVVWQWNVLLWLTSRHCSTLSTRAHWPKLDCGLQRLRTANEAAVDWLTSYGTIVSQMLQIYTRKFLTYSPSLGTSVG